MVLVYFGDHLPGWRARFGKKLDIGIALNGTPEELVNPQIGRRFSSGKTRPPPRPIR